MRRHREDTLSTNSLHERIKQLELNIGLAFLWLDHQRLWPIENRLVRIESQLDRILQKADAEMATIQEILDDETTETADLATLVTVVQGLQQSVTDLQALVAELQAAAGGLTPEQDAQLEAIKAAQDTNDATIKSLLPPV